MARSSAVPNTLQTSSAARFRCVLTVTGARAAWVHAAGELDLCAAPRLEDTLRDAQLRARLVVLDAREVFFIDSAGLRVILAANAGHESGAPRLILVPSPAVACLLTLAGVDGQVWTVDLAASEPAASLGLVPEAAPCAAPIRSPAA